MQKSKFYRLQTDFNAAMSDDNMEACLKLIKTGFVLEPDQNNELIQLERQLIHAQRFFRTKQIDFKEFGMELAGVANGLSGFFRLLKEEQVSIIEDTHERILVVACKDSSTDWERLFPDAYFSHVQIIHFGDEIPAEYLSAGVVILDDLDCAEEEKAEHHAEMKRIGTAMPSANLLYFGKVNPFTSNTEEEKKMFSRMANVNSRFTLHARLQELLEFRKIYGPEE